MTTHALQAVNVTKQYGGRGDAWRRVLRVAICLGRHRGIGCCHAKPLGHCADEGRSPWFFPLQLVPMFLSGFLGLSAMRHAAAGSINPGWVVLVTTLGAAGVLLSMAVEEARED